MGLTAEQFWAMTPRMLDALLKRKQHERQQTEFLFGQIASTIANYSMSPLKKGLAPSDFMPSEMLKKIAKRLRGPSQAERQAMSDHVREYFMKMKREREAGEGTKN